jgi:hypothetical protein
MFRSRPHRHVACGLVDRKETEMIAALFTIWMTLFEATENKRVSDPVMMDKKLERLVFQTYDECEREKQAQIDFGVTAKIYRRVGKDLIEFLPYAKDPHGAGIGILALLECKEVAPEKESR